MKMLQNAENNRRIILFLDNDPEQWWEMLKMNDEGGGRSKMKMDDEFIF